MSVEQEFQKATKYISELPNEGPYKLSKNTRLRFYALQKQGTEGKCTQPKPGFLDFSGKAKWNSWTSLGSMSKHDAMSAYVQEYKKLRSQFEAQSAAQER